MDVNQLFNKKWRILNRKYFFAIGKFLPVILHTCLHESKHHHIRTFLRKWPCWEGIFILVHHSLGLLQTCYKVMRDRRFIDGSALRLSSDFPPLLVFALLLQLLLLQTRRPMESVASMTPTFAKYGTHFTKQRVLQSRQRIFL